MRTKRIAFMALLAMAVLTIGGYAALDASSGALRGNGRFVAETTPTESPAQGECSATMDSSEREPGKGSCLQCNSATQCDGCCLPEQEQYCVNHRCFCVG